MHLIQTKQGHIYMALESQSCVIYSLNIYLALKGGHDVDLGLHALARPCVLVEQQDRCFQRLPSSWC